MPIECINWHLLDPIVSEFINGIQMIGQGGTLTAGFWPWNKRHWLYFYWFVVWFRSLALTGEPDSLLRISNSKLPSEGLYHMGSDLLHWHRQWQLERHVRQFNYRVFRCYYAWWTCSISCQFWFLLIINISNHQCGLWLLLILTPHRCYYLNDLIWLSGFQRLIFGGPLVAYTYSNS